MDLTATLRDLRREVRGGIGDDTLTRGMYGVDASNYRVVPDAVVTPLDTEDLVGALSVLREHGAPTVLRSGGTSMAGNAVGGVVIDVSRHLHHILDIDADAGTATVQPGVVLSHLQAAARAHGLTFGADPSSGTRATLGGMIANNACGAHSVAWGTTSDNVRALDVVTGTGDRLLLRSPGGRRELAELAGLAGPEGELTRRLAAIGEQHRTLIERRFGTFSRQISGYALQHLLPERGVDIARLLAGSEGSLATTLEATVALTRLPQAQVLLALGFPDAGAAADSVPLVLPHEPLTMESINATLVDRLPDDVRRAAQAAGLPAGFMWLLVEVPGEDAHQARTRADAIAESVHDGIPGSTSSVVTDRRAADVLWRCRRDGTGLATRRADGGEAWAGWEDAAVPPSRLGTYLRGLDELMGRFGYSGASYGHFGEGCMHIRIDFDLLSERGRVDYRSFIEQATDLVVSLGGSVSGEHGDGRARGEMVARMYGTDTMEVFEQVKEVFDPAGILNPHVIVDPRPVDADLRQAGQGATRHVATIFSYPDDAGSFAQAQRRCVGVGKCRQTSGGVMCPSYQATREEQHSTRGRARLLSEMLQGEAITDGWRSTEVRDALDLCLSCKGCLSDCPVNVDMATYKAEFTHHHYAGRPWARPRSHWSMGWLPVAARVAAIAPGVVNAVTSSPAAGMIKRLGGIDASREVPSFADEPFTRWFARRRKAVASAAGAAPPSARGPVLLWPDTFTTYLAPEVGRAAVAVLEDAGFEVHLPTGPVCCGLTWTSTGQLGIARRVLERSLATIGPALLAGAPVVGLEPSCTAMLRHDAGQLLGDDPLAALAASQVGTLAETLRDHAPEWEPPQVGGDALVQVHCHQHAVMGFDADRELMARAGVAAQVPDSGCCGLAGNFGFEQGHAQVSRTVGERVLLPAVREAEQATAVLADGFSCRTQIAGETSRRGQHLAQLLAAALPDR